MKSKIFTLVLFLASISVIVPGCLKKGDEDPAVSLKTREARIAGDWKMVSGEISWKFGDTTIAFTYAGAKMKVKENGIFLGDYSSFETISLDKRGKYNRSRTEDGDVYTWEGNWYFGGRNKDLDIKNKETITFVYSERSTPLSRYSYAGLNSGYTYYIERLTGKELVIEMQFTYYDSDGNVVTIDEHWEYEKNGK